MAARVHECRERGEEPEARAGRERGPHTHATRRVGNRCLVPLPGGKVCATTSRTGVENVCARVLRYRVQESRYTQSHHDRRPAGENRHGDTNDDRCGENILWGYRSGTLFTVKGVLHSHTYNGGLLDDTKGLIHTVCMRLRCSGPFTWRRSVCSACGCAHVCGHSSRWLRVFS